MFVRDLADGALALGALDVVILVEERGQSKTLQQNPPERDRPKACAHHKGLLVVDLSLGIALAVVEAGVDVAVVTVEIVVAREPGVGRWQSRGALRKNRTLKPVAVNAFRVVRVR